MKIWQITAESPTDLGKVAPFAFNIDGSYVSQSALARDFQPLGKLTLDNIEYNFWLGNSKSRAMITTEVTDTDIPNAIITGGDGKRKKLVVTDLVFKPCSIPINNAIQIDTVSTNSNYRTRGFATILYIVLTRYGYSMVSDYEQYTGGVMLWKKLSRESTIRKYVVRLWDIVNNTWVVDGNNNPVKYNSNNLADDSIWNSIGKAPNTLLVLSSNV